MPPPDALAYDILRSLRRILRRVGGHSRALSRSAGLTVPQILCLRAIAAGGPEVTVAGVGRAVHLSPSAVSRVLDRLERAGLVQRVRRAQDRRKVCLELTDLGRGRAAALPTPLHDIFLERLLALDDTRRRVLLEALEEIVHLMEAEDLAAAPLLTPDEPGEPPEDA